MLSRDYAPDSSLKLVGDRYELLKRQRVAVGRCVCSDGVRWSRRARMTRPEDVAGRGLWLDGYNVLTTVEAALAGGVLLAARDGTLRDMAGMHGTYRKVAETRPAIERIGRVVERLAAGEVVWYLDRPVSNSGRLRAILLEMAAQAGWPWHVELVADPDPILAQSRAVVATA
ncbi:MAG TPA: DUF434 domain-containing protein, partial [Planctomycetaceae bacterium]|nr:DUF434 domain-containing protein [Planctomycetaceae bacterium]